MPTRLAILSDIHGNLPALQAVLHDLTHYKPDHVIVVGDVIHWGPFSRECVEIVRREGWPAVRGNNEYYLLDYNTPHMPTAWRDASQWPMLPWVYEQLRGPLFDVVAAWPDEISLRYLDAPPIRLTHGVPGNPWHGFYASRPSDVDQLATCAEDFLVLGHTHLQTDCRAGRWRVFNPGTVGVPLDGTHDACYMLLDSTAFGWEPIFRRVAYDNAAIFEAFERQGFLERCGVIGHAVLEEFRTGQIQLTPFLNWQIANCPDATFSMDLWREFEKVDWRAYAPEAYWL